MRKAGGIIALIAGIFAVLAALVTLVVGGVGSAFDAKDAGTVVWLGWGGVLFSFLVIVFGAVCIGASSRVPAVLLILCSIVGAILGGTLVALFMALSLIGGLVAVFATGSAKGVDTIGGHSLQFGSLTPDHLTKDTDAIIAAYVSKAAAAEPAASPRTSSALTHSGPRGGFGRRR